MSSVNPDLAANKAQFDKQVEDTKEKRNQNILFNQQMYLLDALALAPELLNTKDDIQTRFIKKSSDKFSNIIDQNNKKLQDYLTGVTPNEYAQMFPAIKISVVFDELDKEYPLRLTDPNNIVESISRENFYSGKTIGLKNIEMKIDGSTNPVTGKIYNTTMTFKFDSVNTFLGQIPEMPLGLTYATLFRSRAVNKWRLKLEIGYTSNNVTRLKDKFGLDSHQQTFVAFLNFIKSDLQIDENLATEVKVKFQAWEEAIVADNSMFNFLKIDLENAKKSLVVQDTTEAQLKDFKQRRLREIQERINNTIQNALLSKDLKQKYSKKISKVTKVSELKDVISSDFNKLRVTLLDKQTNRAKNHLTVKKLNEIQKTFDNLETEVYNEKQALERDLQIKKEQRLEELKLIRFTLINKVLEEVIFDKAEIINSVALSRQELEEYMNNLFKENTKTYFNAKIASNNISNKSFLKSKPKKGKSFDSRSKDVLDSLPQKLYKGDNGYLKVLQKEQFDLEEKISRAKSEFNPLDPKNEKTKNRLKEIKAKIEKIQQETSIAFDRKDIEKRLLNSLEIPYVLLGDLLESIMERVHQVAENDKQKYEIERTRIVLQNLVLRDPINDTNKVNELYNIPISLTMLSKIFSDKLYGNMSTSMTLFELIDEIKKMLRATQQRKYLHLQRSNVNNDFNLMHYTFPVIEEGNGVRIFRKDDVGKALNGIVIFARGDIKNDFIELGGDFNKNVEANVPHFFVGGNVRGAQRAIKISEISSEALKKAVYERLSIPQNKTGDRNEPVFFEVRIDLLGTPFFQLGNYFYIESPSISKENVNNWFFLDGYYVVTEVQHDYSAGGDYKTSIKGFLQISKQSLDNNRFARSVAIGAVDAINAIGNTAADVLTGRVFRGLLNNE